MSNQENEQSKLEQDPIFLNKLATNASGASRRRLFRAGLAVAPVVMTLASRPVLAWHCTTGSVFASGNTSAAFLQKQGTITNEGTHTKSDYCNKTSYWPSAISSSTKFCSTTNTLVKSAFGGSKKYTGKGSNRTTGDATLLEILNSNCSTSVNPLHQDLIVALLNRTSVQNVQSCITLQNLNDMFVYGTSGTYNPIKTKTSLKWGAAEIHNYLSQNWLLG